MATLGRAVEPRSDQEIHRCLSSAGAVLDVSSPITVATYYNVHAVNVKPFVHAMNIAIIMRNINNSCVRHANNTTQCGRHST